MVTAVSSGWSVTSRAAPARSSTTATPASRRPKLRRRPEAAEGDAVLETSTRSTPRMLPAEGSGARPATAPPPHPPARATRAGPRQPLRELRWPTGDRRRRRPVDQAAERGGDGSLGAGRDRDQLGGGTQHAGRRVGEDRRRAVLALEREHPGIACGDRAHPVLLGRALTLSASGEGSASRFQRSLSSSVHPVEFDLGGVEAFQLGRSLLGCSSHAAARRRAASAVSSRRLSSAPAAASRPRARLQRAGQPGQSLAPVGGRAGSAAGCVHRTR